MTRSTSKRSWFQRRRWSKAVFGTVLLGLVATTSEASPIREFHVHARGAQDLKSWSSFLAGGVGLWSRVHAPHISGAVKYAMASALQLSDPRSSPWIQYLLWRQGRNVARFNFYHPRLGPALQQIPPPTTPPDLSGQGPSTPPRNPDAPGSVVPPPGTVPPPGSVVPPAIPEPNTLLLSIVLIGSGAWWRSRTRRSPLLAEV